MLLHWVEATPTSIRCVLDRGDHPTWATFAMAAFRCAHPGVTIITEEELGETPPRWHRADMSLPPRFRRFEGREPIVRTTTWHADGRIESTVEIVK